jgi:hypothetical protein
MYTSPFLAATTPVRRYLAALVFQKEKPCSFCWEMGTPAPAVTDALQ